MKIKNIKVRFIFEKDVIVKPKKKLFGGMGNQHFQYIKILESLSMLLD